MKKVLQALAMTAFALPAFTFAATDNTQPIQTTTLDKVIAAQGNTTAKASVQNQMTTIISPRTGIRYTLGDTGNRPIIIKTAAIAAANSASVNRIVASNPALSHKESGKSETSFIGYVSSAGGELENKMLKTSHVAGFFIALNSV